MRFSYAETRQTKAVQALTSLWDFEKKKKKKKVDHYSSLLSG